MCVCGVCGGGGLEEGVEGRRTETGGRAGAGGWETGVGMARADKLGNGGAFVGHAAAADDNGEAEAKVAAHLLHPAPHERAALRAQGLAARAGARAELGRAVGDAPQLRHGLVGIAKAGS